MHIYIISWLGQHENAKRIAEELETSSHKVTIVYSDPDPGLGINAACDLIRRPNHLYWGDKFQACLQECKSGADILVIHADCECNDWLHLTKTCREAVNAWPMIGVWSPQIDYVPWDLGIVTIGPLTGTKMNVVVRTDGIVFYLAPSIVKRMKAANYRENIYGWGIEWMFVCAAYCNGMIAVIDTSIQVRHPRTDNTYPRAHAHQQLGAFMQQLTLPEEVQRRFFDALIKCNGGHPITDSN